MQTSEMRSQKCKQSGGPEHQQLGLPEVLQHDLVHLLAGLARLTDGSLLTETMI